MLRVGEEQLTASLWMSADDWMYGRRCPGPQIVIQLAPEISLRVIPPGQINTTPPLQRLTGPFEQPLIRCVCIGKPSVPSAILDYDHVEHRPRCGPLLIRGIVVPHRSHIRKTDIITSPLSGQYQQEFWMAGVRRFVRGMNTDRHQTARKCYLALQRQRLFPKDENQLMDKSAMDKNVDRIIDRARQAQTNDPGTKRVAHGLDMSFVEFTYPSVVNTFVSAIIETREPVSFPRLKF